MRILQLIWVFLSLGILGLVSSGVQEAPNFSWRAVIERLEQSTDWFKDYHFDESNFLQDLQIKKQFKPLEDSYFLKGSAQLSGTFIHRLDKLSQELSEIDLFRLEAKRAELLEVAEREIAEEVQKAKQELREYERDLILQSQLTTANLRIQIQVLTLPEAKRKALEEQLSQIELERADKVKRKMEELERRVSAYKTYQDERLDQLLEHYKNQLCRQRLEQITHLKNHTVLGGFAAKSYPCRDSLILPLVNLAKIRTNLYQFKETKNRHLRCLGQEIKRLKGLTEKRPVRLGGHHGW